MESPSVEQPAHDTELGKDELKRNNQNADTDNNNSPVAPSLPPESSPPPGNEPQKLSTEATITMIRLQRERRLRLTSLGLRFAALLFSFISFVIIAADDQGSPPLKFDKFDEYKYLISVGLMAFVYSGLQLSRGIYDFASRGTLIPEAVSSYMDFIFDQLFAYLLVSCSSAAAALTNRLQEQGESKFTDMAAASVSMGFICFAVVAASSYISGLHLSKRW